MTRSNSRRLLLPATFLLSTLLLSTAVQAQEAPVAADAPAEAAAPADTATSADAVAPADATVLAEPTAPAAEAAPADASDASAVPAPAAEAVAVANPAPTSALSEKVAAVVGTPPEGQAHVVFFRPSKFVGAAIGFKVRENEVELGKLRNGNYFVVAVEPGQHQYVVHSEAKDVTRIEAEAGETYFLSGSLNMGVLAGRPNLSPSDAAAFEAVLPKLKKSKPLD